MAAKEQGAVFVDAGAYENFMGRRSRISGRKFVDWLALAKGLEWLDVGCGTGALGAVVLDAADPAALTGIDPSEIQIAGAGEKISDQRASFRVGDAMALPYDDDSFDVAVSSYALNYVPDKQKKMDEMARVVRPGGTVAAMVFDHAGGEDPARHFLRAMKARDADLHDAEFKKMGWDVTRPDIIEGFFTGAGLADIETHAVAFQDPYDGFDDYWSSLTGLPSAVTTRFAASLSEVDLEKFKTEVRANLGDQAGGAFEITSRSWAVRGRV
jgi:SAM-dependent methyltransferase